MMSKQLLQCGTTLCVQLAEKVNDAHKAKKDHLLN